jgi:hypothetical protein
MTYIPDRAVGYEERVMNTAGANKDAGGASWIIKLESAFIFVLSSE